MANYLKLEEGDDPNVKSTITSNILNCETWCEVNSVDYGVLTGFSPDNTIRSRATNALWNYYINSSDYGVVECCHQIFLHGVV